MRRQIRLASTQAQAEQLNDDFRVVIDDAEALVKATADLGGEKLTAIRARVDQSLKAAQIRMTQIQEAVVSRAKAEVDAADVYVHANPWTAFGVAAGAGLLVGMILSRRS
jgi:ElaB/YqjD/DUF883 family membrane-anchored ribosome-binding protein